MERLHRMLTTIVNSPALGTSLALVCLAGFVFMVVYVATAIGAMEAHPSQAWEAYAHHAWDPCTVERNARGITWRYARRVSSV